MTKILIVLSAADTWTRADGSKYESGVWAEEFVVMDEKFIAEGCTVDIATPGGVAPTIDPHSMNPDVVGQANVDHFRSYLDAIAERLATPLVLADVDGRRYDAIVIPGGHGPVEDLYKDPDMGRIPLEADRAGILIAPVCHGQAALLATRGADGSWPFAGRAMTSFSDEEEVLPTTPPGCSPTLCARPARAMRRVRTGAPMSCATAISSRARIRPRANHSPKRCWQRCAERPSQRGRLHADPAFASGRLETVWF